jgi:endonuclease YncB( thermonuclease family)
MPSQLESLYGQMDSLYEELSRPTNPRPDDWVSEIDSILEDLKPPEQKAWEAEAEAKKEAAKWQPKIKTEYDVSRVIDGDTIDVKGVGPVRLLGLSAPEDTRTKEAGGAAATAFMQELLKGKKVSLRSGPESKDAYGRTLACVHTGSGEGEMCLTTEMLNRKLGIPIEGKIPHGADFKEFERSHAPPPGSVAVAIPKGFLAATAKGVLYPIESMISPDVMAYLNQAIEEGKQAQAFTLSRPDVRHYPGLESEGIRDFWSGPMQETVPQMIGMALPAIKAVQGVRALTGVTQASAISARMAASGAAGALNATLARVDDGESRAAKMALEATMFGVGDEAFALWGAAWKGETGKAGKKVVGQVARRLRVGREAAEGRVTGLRGVLDPTDVEAARAVEKALNDAGLDHTPLKTQAEKIIEHAQIVYPQTATINPHLPFAAQIEVTVDGVPQSIAFSRYTGQPNATELFRAEMQKQFAVIDELRKSGRKVVVKSVTARSNGNWSFIRNRLMPDKRPQGTAPKYTPNPPPKGSVADTGQPLQEGDKVRVDTQAGQVDGVITDTPDWMHQKADEMRASMEADRAGVEAAAAEAKAAVGPQGASMLDEIDKMRSEGKSARDIIRDLVDCD